jgi:hypothetical protein
MKQMIFTKMQFLKNSKIMRMKLMNLIMNLQKKVGRTLNKHLSMIDDFIYLYIIYFNYQGFWGFGVLGLE